MLPLYQQYSPRYPLDQRPRASLVFYSRPQNLWHPIGAVIASMGYFLAMRYTMGWSSFAGHKMDLLIRFQFQQVRLRGKHWSATGSGSPGFNSNRYDWELIGNLLYSHSFRSFNSNRYDWEQHWLDCLYWARWSFNSNRYDWEAISGEPKTVYHTVSIPTGTIESLWQGTEAAGA